MTNVLDFPKTFKKYCNRSGDLNEPFWNNTNKKTNHNNKNKRKKTLKLFSPISPHWSPPLEPPLDSCSVGLVLRLLGHCFLGSCWVTWEMKLAFCRKRIGLTYQRKNIGKSEESHRKTLRFSYGFPMIFL